MGDTLGSQTWQETEREVISGGLGASSQQPRKGSASTSRLFLCPHIQQTLTETLCWSQDPNQMQLPNCWVPPLLHSERGMGLGYSQSLIPAGGSWLQKVKRGKW